MNRPSDALQTLPLIVGMIAVLFAFFVGTMTVLSRSMSSMMGGMMGGQSPGPTWWDAGVLLLAIVVAAIAFAFAFRARQGPPETAAYATPPRFAIPNPAEDIPATTSTADAAQLRRLQEAAIVKTLHEDERRLYIQIREAGGTALQRDLVASRAFSSAKVTRLLDKLERKGLVVRERYGATNRVRLTWKGPPGA